MSDRQPPYSKREAFRRLYALMPGLKPRELKVLLCLVMHIGKDGLSFPSAKLMSEETGIDPRHIERTRAYFRDSGYLTLAEPGNGRGKPNKWRVTLPETPAKPAGLSASQTPAEVAVDLCLETPAGMAKRSAENPGQDSRGFHSKHWPEQPDFVELNPGQISPPNDDNKYQSSSRAGARTREAHSDIASDVVDELMEAGIFRSTSEELARIPNLSHQAVRILRLRIAAANKWQSHEVGLITTIREGLFPKPGDRIRADEVCSWTRQGLIRSIAGHAITEPATQNRHGVYHRGQLIVPSAQLTVESIEFQPAEALSAAI